jgi:predicted RNA-binding protein YlqC (UPF0109 family)
MKKLVEKIVEALVDYPEKIQVDEISSNRTTVIELSVAKEDLGKVIGRHGRTAQALRTILNAAAAKLKRSIVLEIIE